MTIRKSEIQSFHRRQVQFVRRNIVAHLVPSVIGKPEFLCLGMPVESDTVAHAASKDFESGTISLHSIDYPVPFIRSADVARRTDWNIKHPIWTKRDELPPVVPVTRKFIVHHNGLRMIPQLRFDVVVSGYAGNL